MSLDDLYRVVMPAIQACSTYRNIDILSRAHLVPIEERAQHMRMHFALLTDAEREAVETFAELKLAGAV